MPEGVTQTSVTMTTTVVASNSSVAVSTLGDNGTGTLPVDDGVTRILRLYVTAAFIGVGLMGNSISVALLICTKLKYQSSSHYITAAIVANTFCLFATSLKWAAILDVELYNSAGWCQFVTFIENTCVFLSVWSTVAFGVDRYINSRCPSKARILCSTFRAKSVVVAMALVATVVYMNISLIIGVVNEPETDEPLCSPLPDYLSNMKVLRTVDIAVNFVIPYLAIFILGVGMCRFACCDTGREDDGVSDDAQLAKMTCTFLGLFLVLRMPREVLRLTHSPHLGLMEATKGGSTESAVPYYCKAAANQLYLASLSLHFIVLLFSHKGFAFFFKKTLARPARCLKERRRLMVQTEQEDLALDNLPADGTRVYV